MKGLAWGTLDTPVGPVSVGCTPAGVAEARFGEPPQPAGPDSGAGGAVPPAPHATPLGAPHATPLGAALAELKEYFGGRRKVFTVPVDLSAVSGARRTVLDVLFGTVGYGQTITYGGLAARAGLTGDGAVPPDRGDVPPARVGVPPARGEAPPARGAAAPARVGVPPARVVGQFMASNPVPIIVPCHRVVAGNGLGGFSGGTGTDIKQWLLIFEGAIPPTLDWDAAGVPRLLARAAELPVHPGDVALG